MFPSHIRLYPLNKEIKGCFHKCLFATFSQSSPMGTSKPFFFGFQKIFEWVYYTGHCLPIWIHCLRPRRTWGRHQARGPHPGHPVRPHPSHQFSIIRLKGRVNGCCHLRHWFFFVLNFWDLFSQRILFSLHVYFPNNFGAEGLFGDKFPCGKQVLKKKLQGRTPP